MSSLIFSILIFYFSIFSISGNCGFNESCNCVPLSKIKSKSTCYREPETYIYTTTKPKIHQSVWPHFCLNHLQKAPASCSSWEEDKQGNIVLEFNLLGSASSYIDPCLVQQIENYASLIPECSWIGQGRCNYAWCPGCSQSVMLSVGEYDDGDEAYYDEYDNLIYSSYICYRCECTGCWIDLRDCPDKFDEIVTKWQFCHNPTIYPGYFDWHHQTYFSHFKNYLHYVADNASCGCYWPQVTLEAKHISDSVYKNLRVLLNETALRDIIDSFNHYLKSRTQFGFISGVLSHVFFYSDYREVLADLDQHSKRNLDSYDYEEVHERIVDFEEKLQIRFLELYDQCLSMHPHPKVYYERGMVRFHGGCSVEALADIQQFISFAEKNNYAHLLTSDLYLREGRLLGEMLSYDEAIKSLTKSITKNPKNIEAVFERAIAYFETGDFESALSDYLTSSIRPVRIDSKDPLAIRYLQFGQGMVLGILKGGQDALVEFVPSLLSCLRGVSRGIWACTTHPVEVSKDVIDSVQACIDFIRLHTPPEMYDMLAPEVKELLDKWHQLNEEARGQYVGRIVGKLGVDIFAATGSIKAIKLYRDLRRANAVMTLDAAATSPWLAQEIFLQASREESLRKKVLASGNLKIQWDKQGKHIKGHRNYVPALNKSILMHEDPQLLIRDFAGSGRKIGNAIPGEAGYKEVVEFHEIIGMYVNPRNGKQFATTKGRIHYANDGVHIVPEKPYY